MLTPKFWNITKALSFWQISEFYGLTTIIGCNLIMFINGESMGIFVLCWIAYPQIDFPILCLW